MTHMPAASDQATSSFASRLVSDDIGAAIYATASDIFPICRSITGNGVRATLSRLGEVAAIDTREVPSGQDAFDWTIPKEWNIRDAYIRAPSGDKIADFNASNLHVLGYSQPVHAQLPLSQLKQHIYTLPDQPDLIPYRTAYAGDRWGFCMPHRQLEALTDGTYEVLIDASLEDGSLTYGEAFHQGETRDEILLSAHICHPSLANDNCSGLALLAHLAARIKQTPTRYSYRFIFAPGTIGAIAWLAANRRQVSHVKHGLVLSCVGDAGGPTYKKSRRGDAKIDRAMAHVLQHAGGTPNIIDFSPYGYDERQYCSPGFDLGVGLFQRSQFATFPEYHTSADNLDFIAPEHLATSYLLIVAALDILENDAMFLTTVAHGEPQLGKRGLYPSVGGEKLQQSVMALLWTVNLSDGSHSLLDIAERASLPFSEIYGAARKLRAGGLLEPAGA